MLNAFARHGLFDLKIEALGDTEVDAHHTVEDTGIVLGQAFAQALGDKQRIKRFADVAIPMDETLVMAAVDISGARAGVLRPPAADPARGRFRHRACRRVLLRLRARRRVTLHVRELAGENSHHIIEAAFKAVGRAMRFACEQDARVRGIPSTKGSL